MTAYLDASVIVKRFVEECDSAATVRFIDSCEVRCTSILTRTEVAAALARAQRSGRLAKADLRDALEQFAAYWLKLIRSGVDEALAVRAAELSEAHGLRAYDALHLASGLRLAEVSASSFILATADRQLAMAAQRCGLAVWPETL